jgi:hypothetical protein
MVEMELRASARRGQSARHCLRADEGDVADIEPLETCPAGVWPISAIVLVHTLRAVSVDPESNR